jgi:hypothetical protein
LRRIKDSLLFPKNIAQYSQDKLSKVILYLIFLLALIILPSILVIYTSPPLDEPTKDLIRNQSFYLAETVNCEISESKLSCDEDRPYLVNIDDLNISVVFYPKADKDVIGQLKNRKAVVIIMEEARATMTIQSNIPGFRVGDVEIIRYQDLPELNGLNFRHAKDRKDFVFWNQFFGAVSLAFAKHQEAIHLGFTIVAALQGTFSLLFSILMFTVLIRLFNNAYPISFGEVFKLVTYSFTPYAVVSIIAVLYGIDWLINVGMFISFFYAYISTGICIRNRLLKQ